MVQDHDLLALVPVFENLQLGPQRIRAGFDVVLLSVMNHAVDVGRLLCLQSLCLRRVVPRSFQDFGGGHLPAHECFALIAVCFRLFYCLSQVFELIPVHVSDIDHPARLTDVADRELRIDENLVQRTPLEKRNRQSLARLRDIRGCVCR